MDAHKLAPAYPWNSDIVLPEQVTVHIDQLLALAQTCHIAGIEMRQVFIGVKADGEGIFMDVHKTPREMLSSWVMMNADKHKCVALIMCSEGWTVPDHVAKEWAEKSNRPEGEIKDHPEVIEVLMIGVETLKGHWFAREPIIGEGDNRTVKKPLQLKKADAAAGMHCNLLRANWMKDPEGTLHKATMAREYVEKDQSASS